MTIIEYRSVPFNLYSTYMAYLDNCIRQSNIQPSTIFYIRTALFMFNFILLTFFHLLTQLNQNVSHSFCIKFNIKQYASILCEISENPVHGKLITSGNKLHFTSYFFSFLLALFPVRAFIFDDIKGILCVAFLTV